MWGQRLIKRDEGVIGLSDRTADAADLRFDFLGTVVVADRAQELRLLLKQGLLLL